MEIEPEKQEEIDAHPLFADYQATRQALQDANKREDYYVIEGLEERLSSLALKIQEDLDLFSQNPA